ncbi:hypothetical protein ACUXHH_001075 [Rothia sp. 110740021-2]
MIKGQVNGPKTFTVPVGIRELSFTAPLPGSSYALTRSAVWNGYAAAWLTK